MFLKLFKTNKYNNSNNNQNNYYSKNIYYNLNNLNISQIYYFISLIISTSLNQLGKITGLKLLCLIKITGNNNYSLYY